MASLSREKMASRHSSKRKSGSPVTGVFKGDKWEGENERERGIQNESEKTTKLAKICLDRLRRGLPKSRRYSQRQGKAEMDK